MKAAKENVVFIVVFMNECKMIIFMTFKIRIIISIKIYWKC